jgi:hypothetical protein
LGDSGTLRAVRGAVIGVTALCVVAAAHTARADDRPWHGAIGAGGFVALTGPAPNGLAAEAEVYPGSRFGARVHGRTFEDDGDAGLLLGGLVYEAAAARPRLALALHAEAGARLPEARAVLGGGVTTQLSIIGPIAVALDSAAHFIFDGVDSELMLSTALTLRVFR